jgi:hypothetical protein
MTASDLRDTPRHRAAKTARGLFAPFVRPAMAGIVGAACLIATALPASAMSVDQARKIIGNIMSSHGITATETAAQAGPNGAATLKYDDVRIPVTGYGSARVLVMDGLSVTADDTKDKNLADLDIALPKRAHLEADKTFDQREITLQQATAKLTWNIAKGIPTTFNAVADLVAANEPVSRQHWLMHNLDVAWNAAKAVLSSGQAEWTGPGEEKLGAMTSAKLVLFPGKAGETHMDYAHDGLWLPNLIQPRTVRIKSHSAGVPWADAQKILQKGINDLLTGMSPRQARRQIGNALWHQAVQSGKPIIVDDLYVSGRGLEVAGNGQFVASKSAHYGFAGNLDMNMTGKDRLQFLVGTPQNPTILGALFPPAVDGLAAGKPGEKGITQYDVQLLADGRITVNGITVMGGKNG